MGYLKKIVPTSIIVLLENENRELEIVSIEVDVPQNASEEEKNDTYLKAAYFAAFGEEMPAAAEASIETNPISPIQFKGVKIYFANGKRSNASGDRFIYTQGNRYTIRVSEKKADINSNSILGGKIYTY